MHCREHEGCYTSGLRRRVTSEAWYELASEPGDSRLHMSLSLYLQQRCGSFGYRSCCYQRTEDQRQPAGHDTSYCLLTGALQLQDPTSSFLEVLVKNAGNSAHAGRPVWQPDWRQILGGVHHIPWCFLLTPCSCVLFSVRRGTVL